MSQVKPARLAETPFHRPLVCDPVSSAVEALVRAVAALPEQDEVAVDVELPGFRVVCWRTSRREHAPSLSPREQEIARLIAVGHPNKVIADVLEISEWTVCTHLRRMFAKLQVCSRAALVAKLAPSAPVPANS